MENNECLMKIKNQTEIFRNKEDFMKYKKDKILSLRNKKNKRNNIHRIIFENENKGQEKYNIYEFDENEFHNAKLLYNKNKNDIYKLCIEELINKNYDNEVLKYWLYSMNKISLTTKINIVKEKVLNNMTDKKVNFLIKILVDTTLLNTNNNIEQLKNQIKFKYNACSLLINILYDTNKYNTIYIDKIKDVYDFINILIDLYNNTKEQSFLILITHYQWFINNGIQKDTYNIILHKYPTINFPILIQKIFNINNSELYINNIRMLSLYLYQQLEPETFYQYNNFIKDLENIIFYSLQNNNICLLNESYGTLNILLNSKANCKLILENKQYIKLLSSIINGFNNISYCNCCLCKLIKNDDNNLINKNYEIYKIVYNIILNKTYSNKDAFKHSLKILRLLFKKSNKNELSNFIINNSYQNFFMRLQQIYFEIPNNLLVQSEIFNFYENLFNLSNNSLKSQLLLNGLHNFTLNCLESSYEEFLSENKDNSSYIKLMKKILNLLITILKFGEGDLKMKISLKNCCEEKNIYYILNELNYNKNSDIQNLIETLNNDFFEGYEKEEEFNDDENGNEKEYDE